MNSKTLLGIEDRDASSWLANNLVGHVKLNRAEVPPAVDS
jgi:hypothetical protein